MENLGLGLVLILVGITTVFVILLIVIWGGELLIYLINKIAPPEEEKPQAQRPSTGAVDGTTMAVLQQVVSQITGGKGHVVSAREI